MTESSLIKTTDPVLCRDEETGAIINIDNESYKTFLKERERILHLDKVTVEVKNLQQDVTEIKQMLRQLLNGKNNG